MRFWAAQVGSAVPQSRRGPLWTASGLVDSLIPRSTRGAEPPPGGFCSCWVRSTHRLTNRPACRSFDRRRSPRGPPGCPCFDRATTRAYTCLGRVLRSGPRPLSLGRTTSPAPSQSPFGPRRSLLRTMSRSGFGGIPAIQRPSGVTTRSAISSPAPHVVLVANSNAAMRRRRTSGRTYRVPFRRSTSHAMVSSRSSRSLRRSTRSGLAVRCHRARSRSARRRSPG